MDARCLRLLPRMDKSVPSHSHLVNTTLNLCIESLAYYRLLMPKCRTFGMINWRRICRYDDRTIV